MFSLLTVVMSNTGGILKELVIASSLLNSSSNIKLSLRRKKRDMRKSNPSVHHSCDILSATKFGLMVTKLSNV